MSKDEINEEGCTTAFDLGWKHGTEDIYEPFEYRPDIPLSKSLFEDYKSGYKDARQGWD